MACVVASLERYGSTTTLWGKRPSLLTAQNQSHRRDEMLQKLEGFPQQRCSISLWIFLAIKVHAWWMDIPHMFAWPGNRSVTSAFPLVLSYGMTVHKSQGLTLHEGCVFDMEHEPTWQPFRSICGTAFVGLSRVTDFRFVAFRHVPDYWVFRAVSDTQLFRWRASLELQLDAKHDATSKRQFFGKASLEDNIARHVSWSEKVIGLPMSQENKNDLMQMLAVRGVLAAPVYTDKPQRLPATKLGGGRNKRRIMCGSDAGQLCRIPVRAVHGLTRMRTCSLQKKIWRA